MANTIGRIPEFSDGGQPEEVNTEDVKPQEEQLPPQEKTTEETEPIGEQEAVKPEGETISEDTGSEVLKTQLQALEETKKALLDEITDLRGQRRKLKEAEIGRVEDKIEQVQADIQDVNPEDIKVIDKINRSRGYMTQADVKRMFYEEVKQEVLDSFLSKYPEYKPENDLNDTRWNALQKEISWYKMPENPRMIATLLERARKAITPNTSEQNTTTVRKQLSTAAVGSQGIQRSSPSPSINPDLRAMLHGFDEEDIKNISKRLNK